jgi:hypothetical protein
MRYDDPTLEVAYAHADCEECIQCIKNLYPMMQISCADTIYSFAEEGDCYASASVEPA